MSYVPRRGDPSPATRAGSTTGGAVNGAAPTMSGTPLRENRAPTATASVVTGNCSFTICIACSLVSTLAPRATSSFDGRTPLPPEYSACSATNSLASMDDLRRNACDMKSSAASAQPCTSRCIHMHSSSELTPISRQILRRTVAT